LRLRRLIAKDLRLARKANRVLAAEVPAGACRRSLLASRAELRGGERAVRRPQGTRGRLAQAVAATRATRVGAPAQRLDGSVRGPRAQDVPKLLRAGAGRGAPTPTTPAPVI